MQAVRRMFFGTFSLLTRFSYLSVVRVLLPLTVNASRNRTKLELFGRICQSFGSNNLVGSNPLRTASWGARILDY